MAEVTDAAAGRWRDILGAIGGLSDKQLSDTHQPCPLCGGKDRYRFDDLDGTGSWFCNKCGGKHHSGGGGSGMDLLMRLKNWDFKQAADAVERHLGIKASDVTVPKDDAPTRGAISIWKYTESFLVCRFPDRNGSKVIRPLWHNGSKWVWKAPPAPRPLYKAQEVARRSDAPVLVCEGEKAADAAAKLFPSAVCITWASGCKAISKSTWEPLAGRRVVLWPDNDEVGRSAMELLAQKLTALNPPPKSIRIVEPPADKAEGWDLADAEWTPAEAAAYVKAHLRAPTPAAKPDTPIESAIQSAEDSSAAPMVQAPRKVGAHELLLMIRSQNAFRFNVFTQQIEHNGVVVKGAERFYLALAQEGYQVSKELALDCMIQVANENPYDPVRLYLEHVAQTVEPTYIDALATTYLRPKDQPGSLYDEMLKRTLIGAVKRVFEPGCKHDTACVLMGDQGAAKSTFWSTLGGPFFSDALRSIENKDDLMVLHRSWLMEWAEIDHITSRKHAGMVKAFLSQSTDLFRVPYGKATEAFPRRGIIVGSTNRSTGFLVDDTGNRRFWVIPTPKNEADQIDCNALAAERDAIWSAAVHAYRNGEPNYLSAHRAMEVTRENEDYLIDSPWLSAISSWLETRATVEAITTERILTEAVLKPTERQTRGDQMQVADILKRLGYDRKRDRVNGERVWRWYKRLGA